MLNPIDVIEEAEEEHKFDFFGEDALRGGERGGTNNNLDEVLELHCPERNATSVAVKNEEALTAVDSNAFGSRYPYVRSISLNMNSIAELSGTFVGCGKLRELHLSQNKIATLKESLFANLTQLRVLNMDVNLLTDIKG